MTQYDLKSAEFLRNPYPVYDELRANDPIYWSAENGYWIITRYADIVAQVQNDRLSSNRIGAHQARMPEAAKEHFRPFFTAVGSWMLMIDPPDHTRLRALVSKAFTPGVVENMRALVQKLVDEMLAHVKERGRMDVMTDLANPLPAIVIAELLGVSGADQQQFKAWSDDIAMGLGGIDTARTKEELFSLYDLAQKSFIALADYFRVKVAELRTRPSDNLLSALIQAEEQGDRLTESELFANCVLLMIAGHETTTNLIGNGVLALLRNPEQKDQLAHNPQAIVSAVEELLRYDSPVQKMGRIALANLDIGGKQIKQGDLVCVSYAAGNRDPEQFASPAQLDIMRKPNRHLAFGHGLHYCVGAALARLEGQIAINTMLNRLPELRLETEDMEWNRNLTLRGLKSLPVAF
ncbi:MAG TPA: cytochrome P450 [Pyrinomonadaceae bacterium]|jgi:cytochrome P450|nr:cytochrome P450 [Pyrinomonadaceae bacterium]